MTGMVQTNGDLVQNGDPAAPLVIMGGDTQVNDLVVEWYLAISMIVRGSKD